MKLENIPSPSSVVRGDRGDAPQARGEARRNNAPRIAGEARARMRLAPRARRSPLCAYCLWAGRVTTR